MSENTDSTHTRQATPTEPMDWLKLSAIQPPERLARELERRGWFVSAPLLYLHDGDPQRPYWAYHAIRESEAGLSGETQYPVECAWCGSEIDPGPKPIRSSRGELFCSRAHRDASARAVRRLRASESEAGS